jgi:hypothetical protein
MNRWLDSLVSDDRTYDARWKTLAAFDPRNRETDAEPVSCETSHAKALFYWCDLIYDHAALRMHAPEGTLCLTVLREPVQRLASQVADWRRFVPDDIANVPLALRESIADIQRLPLREYLERYGHGASRRFLDNYLTRALAAGRIGGLAQDVADAGRLCDVALKSLEDDYDLVGLVENFDLTRNAFCAVAGIPPASTVQTVNATSRPGDGEIRSDDTRYILKSLTRYDEIVYQRARELFDQRHRRAAEQYDAVEYESLHAARGLAVLRGTHCFGATRFTVRQPVAGSGFHSRDGAGTDSCAIWTGPECRTTLYVPAPPNMNLSMLVWIRGYVAARQRDQIRVRVDGKAAFHRFESLEEYADILVVDTRSTRNFVRLEIEIDETLQSCELDSAFHDARRRGFAFDSYGWRPR